MSVILYCVYFQDSFPNLSLCVLVTKMVISSRKQVCVTNTPYTPLCKTGVYRGILFSYVFLLQNIDCGYSLEPPH